MRKIEYYLIECWYVRESDKAICVQAEPRTQAQWVWIPKSCMIEGMEVLSQRPGCPVPEQIKILVAKWFYDRNVDCTELDECIVDEGETTVD